MNLSSNQEISVNIRKNIVSLLFLSSLILTLLTNTSLILPILGWILLAVLFFYRADLIPQAILFYASFFYSTNFFPHLFFSLKHYQLVIVILFAIQIIKGELIYTLQECLRNLNKLWPIFALIFLFIISSKLNGHFKQDLPYQLNLTMTLLSVVYLTGYFHNKREVLANSIVFFILGLAFQIIVGFGNAIFNTHFLNLVTLHNRHIGIQASFTIFYALGMLVLSPSQKLLKKIFLSTLSIILVLGLLFSNSRSAYIGFLPAFVAFLIFVRYISKNQALGIQAQRKVLFIPLFSIPFLLAMMLIDIDILARFASLFLELFNIDTWLHCFHDTQNFGFLGKFRMNQLYEIATIWKYHPFIGIGFGHRTLDFHSMYFTLLGSGGILGILIFFISIYYLINQTKSNFGNIQSIAQSTIILGAFCALISWLFSSMTETYFLQFAPWMNILILLVFLDKRQASLNPITPLSETKSLQKKIRIIWFLALLLFPTFYNFGKLLLGYQAELSYFRRHQNIFFKTSPKQLNQTTEARIVLSIELIGLFFLILFLLKNPDSSISSSKNRLGNVPIKKEKN